MEGREEQNVAQCINYLCGTSCFSYVEVFSCGAWVQLSSLQDPELKRLARALPHTVLTSRADSTTKKYLYAFGRWKEWAEGRKEVTVFPVQDLQFALYLQHLSETTESRSAVEVAVSAISWAHQLAGLQPISGSPFVGAVLAGLQRKLAKPKSKKEPITPDMLSAMVKSCDGSLSDLRLMAMALLAFSAFLRCDELIKLRACDVSFAAEHMVITLPRSKTDQYRDGSTVMVARSGTPTCPVAMLEQYFSKAALIQSSTALVFRGIVNTKTGERLRKSGGISYSRVRELMLQRLSRLGFDPTAFGMHSFRAGGATAAANAGVPDRLFKRHGRWKSDTAKDGYVKDSEKSRLSVSQSLEL